MKPTVRRLAVWRGSSAAGTLNAEAAQRRPRVDPQAQAGARRRPPALGGEQRAAGDGLELQHDRLGALALALAGDRGLQRVDAEPLQLRRGDRRLVARLAADAQLAAVERVAERDALGLGVADLGRDEDRREPGRRAGGVGADADGADAAEREPAVLRVARELLAARGGDEAAGHVAEVGPVGSEPKNGGAAAVVIGVAAGRRVTGRGVGAAVGVAVGRAWRRRRGRRRRSGRRGRRQQHGRRGLRGSWRSRRRCSSR